MEINIQETQEKIIVTLDGELDTASAIEVEKQLQPLYNIEGHNIVIDCTNLEYIASTGLRILLNILKQSKAHNNNLVLKNVNEDIQDVFKLTGFNTIFNFE